MTRRFIAILLLAAAPFMGPAAAEPVTARPGATILLDLVAQGRSLIAVGERGTVLRSDDEGATWIATRPATTRTLTAIAFGQEGTGVAVGHGGTLLRSPDEGRSWVAVPVPEAGKDALLGVAALPNGHFIAYGAFGLFLQSGDSGLTWTRRTILGEEFDRHIYKLVARSSQELLLVGESGALAASSDGGISWHRLDSPYAGSYFGALVTRDGATLIFGMRGHVFRASAPGAPWNAVPTGSGTTFNNGLVLADGRVLLVGNNGIAAISGDGGKSFRTVKVARTANLAQAAQAASGVLVAGSDMGILSLTELGAGNKDQRDGR